MLWAGRFVPCDLLSSCRNGRGAQLQTPLPANPTVPAACPLSLGSWCPPSPATGQRGSPRAVRPGPALVDSVLALLQKKKKPQTTPISIGDCPELTQSHLYFCPKTSSFSQSQQFYYTVAGRLSEPSSKSPARTLGPPTFNHPDI